VGIPVPLAVKTVLDVVVVDWGMRSVTALPVPIRINELPASALKWLPGIPKKAIAKVIAKRPFHSLEEYRKEAGSSSVDGVLKF
jgi:radical SAM superfamily enzyme with C-terminal helix-hairpin-helix motif